MAGASEVLNPRRCAACGAVRARAELLRVVRTPDGRVETGGAQGRGAYICPNASCLERAKKRRSIARALKVERVDDELFARLAEKMTQ